MFGDNKQELADNNASTPPVKSTITQSFASTQTVASADTSAAPQHGHFLGDEHLQAKLRLNHIHLVFQTLEKQKKQRLKLDQTQPVTAAVAEHTDVLSPSILECDETTRIARIRRIHGDDEKEEAEYLLLCLRKKQEAARQKEMGIVQAQENALVIQQIEPQKMNEKNEEIQTHKSDVVSQQFSVSGLAVHPNRDTVKHSMVPRFQ